MIEIEVEMDSDVVAAEAVSNVVRKFLFSCILWFQIPYKMTGLGDFCLQESIAEQIQQIMELENLEEACSWIFLYFPFLSSSSVFVDIFKVKLQLK